jgi:competence protein ComEC
VVDAGPLPAAVDGCLRRLRVTTVPLVVLSHFHADHVEGLPGVLSGRPVGGVAVGPLAEPPVEAGRVRAWSAAARVPLRSLQPGAAFPVGSAAVQVIAPVHVLHGTDSDPNNDSLVLRVRAGGLTLLLTGDVETPAQQALVAAGLPLRADVLKVPHHGSADQDPAFLAAVHPRVAVVSVGAHNTYGHPAPATLARLAGAGVPTYRTDRDGDVAVVGHGGAAGLHVVRRSGRHLFGAVTGAFPAFATAATAMPTAGEAASPAAWAGGLPRPLPSAQSARPGMVRTAGRPPPVARSPPARHDGEAGEHAASARRCFTRGMLRPWQVTMCSRR